MEETVQERTVLEKKVSKIFINGKNTMAMLDTDELKDIVVVRSIAYLFPQVGQKRL